MDSNPHLFNRYILFLKKDRKKTPNTIVAYSSDIKQFMDFLDYESCLKCTKEKIEEFIKKLDEDEFLSAKTISRKLNSLRHFYRFLIINKLVKENPARIVAHPKQKASSPRVLSNDELNSLRSSCSENIRLYMMIEIFLQCGLQITELVNLKLSDINIDGSSYIKIGKSLSTRTINLSNKIKYLLKGFIDDNFKNTKPNAYLFLTSRGNKFNVRNIRKAIDETFSKADITGANINTLRNTFIMKQLSSGMPKEILGEIAGFKSQKAVERYVKFVEDYRENEKIKVPVEV